jgi:hypothetical protein
MSKLRALLAAAALALAGGAAALVQQASDAAHPPVTSRNWRSHPKILAVHRLVKRHQAATVSRRWLPDPARHCRSPEGASAADAIAIRDEQRRIRTYVVSEGSEGSAYRIEHHYDGLGFLRFAFARAGAPNGSSVEYRIYFDEWGKEVWREIRARGAGTAFLRPPEFPDEALVRDPVVAVAIPLRCAP